MSYRPSTDADLSGNPRARAYDDSASAAYIDTELARREAGEVTPTLSDEQIASTMAEPTPIVQAFMDGPDQERP